MAWVALLLAAGAVALVALPGAGKLLAVGLGIAAVAAGLLAWRRRQSRAGARLGGAAAVALGSLGLVLGATKVALTFVAIERLARVFR